MTREARRLEEGVLARLTARPRLVCPLCGAGYSGWYALHRHMQHHLDELERKGVVEVRRFSDGTQYYVLADGRAFLSVRDLLHHLASHIESR